jgi:PAS domain-containing protein
MEIIYILTNEAMPGYVKIGKTSTNMEQRIRELSSSTSVPLPFTCFYACTVKDANFAEHQLHDAFDNNRINPKREFFQIAPERVVSALKLAEIENITPQKEFFDNKEDQQALHKARAMRSIFRFSMVNIPNGAELVFSRDENKKAKVVDDRAIEFNGKITSLSASAREILGYKYGVAGTDYWMYEGETLDERRRKSEEQELLDYEADRDFKDYMGEE